MPPVTRSTMKTQEAACDGIETEIIMETMAMVILTRCNAHVFDTILKTAMRTNAKAAAMRPTARSVSVLMRWREAGSLRWRWNHAPAADITIKPGRCQREKVRAAPGRPPNVAPRDVTSCVEPGPGKL